jgi:uncharacterized repeat protein (TIGR02543 family)
LSRFPTFWLLHSQSLAVEIAKILKEDQSMSKSIRPNSSRVVLITAVTFIAAVLAAQLYFARRAQAASTTVVISEFRVRGPNGGNDEFIELYNLTNSPINIGGWKINGSNNAGTTSTRVTIASGTMIPAHGHFLATNSGSAGYSGSVTGNQTYTTGVTDDGGIALLTPSDVIVDQVGMSVGSAYKEGTVLASLGGTTASNLNRGYERKPGGANGSTTDTDNNANDFQLITPSDPQNLASTPTPSGPVLSVTLSGTGSGTVSSSPAGINCPGTCSASYTSGTPVTLTAVANAGSAFTSWSGCDSTSGNTCNVTMTASKSVTATFSAVQQTLTVTKNGTGGGAVTSSPAGINCGGTCSASYNNGTLVTLTATPDGTSAFTVWGGCDSSSGNQCSVTMNSARNVTATFTTTQRVLTVNRTGTGTGTVTSSPAGINCGATCSATYADNTPVTLTAAASLNNTFDGWTGCDSASGNTCNVTMSGDKTVTANFSFVPTPPGAVVISQIYGGGGNAGATLKNDFIELFNRSSNPVDLSGWSVQYNSATGSGNWSGKTSLSGVIPAGGYYLVKEAAQGGGTVNLPAPDATGTISMGATAGKVALVNNTATLNGCPSGSTIIDLVGYGSTANCSEGGAPTADLGNTLAAIRTHKGCRDTDVNAAEFKVLPPSPRNSSTPLHLCSAGDLEPEVFSTTPNDGATSIPLATNLSVQFDEPVTVSGNWFSISCASSGMHTATVSGGPTMFTINPDTDFLALEQCTVTIFAGQVSDQDVNDPPDNMEADYTFTFLTGHDPQVNIAMGNPSNATPDESNENNYLMEKEQYTLSYNRSKDTANWVSWQLDQTWLGSAPRQDDFRADDTLPATWYHVLQSDYQFGTYGFDRGHMCPSADRTATIDDNSHTFLMTNMVPQASGNNQGPWGDFENYLRQQIGGGANRLYIISGPAGVGGVSSTGTFSTIPTPGGGAITVPAWTWKVALVLPVGVNDVSRVDNSTRTIAVIMPNHDDIRPDDWQKYLATVDQVEALSGYDFYSNVPTSIQNVIEARLDAVNDTAPVASNGSGTAAEDGTQSFTLSASDVNVNNVLTFTITGGPSHGSVGAVSAPTCSNGNCIATVSYTPATNYNGPDSLTFTVNDGAFDSNTATFNVNVTEVNDDPSAVNDSKSVAEDSSLIFAASDLTANDSAGPNEASQALTVSAVITTPNTHGNVALNAGQITYTPDGNYNGPASFDYQVCDNGTTNGSPDAKCVIATVDVTVSPVNDPPMAFNQSVSTDSNTSLPILLAGSDLETPSSLTFTVTGGPSHGSLSGSGANLTYTPALDYAGMDSFTFTVTDAGDGTSSSLTSSPATVAITVKDKVPPVITPNGNSISLWPVNQSMHTINVTDLVASASDNFDQSINLNSVVIASVSSDEGTAGSGDIAIASNCKSVQLRATRDGNGDGRVYTITFKVTDADGNTGYATAMVTVPHDQGNGKVAIDSEAAYTVNSSCP